MEMMCGCGVQDGESDEDDDEDDEGGSSHHLDLTRFTNDTAGVEVAVECLRCAQRIGLVVARGDFEISLAAAKRLKHSHVRVPPLLQCTAAAC
jgi:hypothetical protein